MKNSETLTVADLERIPALMNGFYENRVGTIKRVRPTKDILIALSPIGLVVVDGINDYEKQTRIFKWDDYGINWAYSKKELDSKREVID